MTCSSRDSARSWVHRKQEWYIISSIRCSSRYEIHVCRVLSNVWFTKIIWRSSSPRHTWVDDKVCLSRKKLKNLKNTPSINFRSYLITYLIAAWRFPSLRVAYVEEKEEIVADKPLKVYSSILVKAVNGFDQVRDQCSLLQKSSLVGIY